MKSRSPQARQPGRGLAAEISACSFVQTSNESSSAPQLLSGCAAYQKFERFGGCDRGHQVHRRIQNAGSFAGLDHATRRVREDAGQASGLPGHDVQCDGVASDRSGINPGQGAVDGIVVDQVASFEIVGAVEDQRHSFKQGFNVCRDQIFDLRLNSRSRELNAAILRAAAMALGKDSAASLLIE